MPLKEMYWVIKWCFEWWLIGLFHALPVFFIKYCHKLCIYKDMKACQLSSVWKILEKELFYSPSTLILHWIKLENFVMQLKRQSVEVWQSKKHYSKENNTSENPIPTRKMFKLVNHVKYEGQDRSQNLLFVQFSRSAFKLSCHLQKLL